tara:strand:- start:832 stop:1515 length:684 start_codon:yes stop_codon:yes gene_type:complete
MSLPTIEMPAPVPEPEVFPDKTEKIIDTLENKQVQLVVEDISSEEEDLSDKEEDVFKAPVIKQIVAEDEDIPEIPEKKVRKKYERTKPMSDKQKAHLERIRKIAADKKRVVREEKAKAKEDADLKKVEEKIKKQQEKYEQDTKDKIKAEHEDNIKMASSARYSQSDLEEAMVNAVSTYDTLRKERKIEKKKLQEQEARKTAQKNMISRAIQPNYISPSQTQFSHCFT